MIRRLAIGLLLTAMAGLVLRPAFGADSGIDSLKRAFLSLSRERTLLERENRLLGLEMELVSRDTAYAVLDLRSRQLRFKLRGVEVRAYDLFDLTVKGDLEAWPDSARKVAGPFTVSQKVDLGPPPVPVKPKPRSPLDILPPDPVDPTPTYFDLCLGEDAVLHVVPGDSTQLSEGGFVKRVLKRAAEMVQDIRHGVGRALGWEAEDRRIHIFLRIPHEQAQALFRTTRIGMQAILLL